MATFTKCEDCDSIAEVRLSPYGAGFMAEFICPKCGVSYDTNLDSADVAQIGA